MDSVSNGKWGHSFPIAQKPGKEIHQSISVEEPEKPGKEPHQSVTIEQKPSSTLLPASKQSFKPPSYMYQVFVMIAVICSTFDMVSDILMGILNLLSSGTRERIFQGILSVISIIWPMLVFRTSDYYQ